MGRLYHTHTRLGIRCLSSQDSAELVRLSVVAGLGMPSAWSTPADGLTVATALSYDLGSDEGTTGWPQHGDAPYERCLARSGDGYKRILWPVWILDGMQSGTAPGVRALVVRGPAAFQLAGSGWNQHDPAYGTPAEVGIIFDPSKLAQHCAATLDEQTGWIVWLAAPQFWPYWIEQQATAAGIKRDAKTKTDKIGARELAALDCRQVRPIVGSSGRY